MTEEIKLPIEDCRIIFWALANLEHTYDPGQDGREAGVGLEDVQRLRAAFEKYWLVR